MVYENKLDYENMKTSWSMQNELDYAKRAGL